MHPTYKIAILDMNAGQPNEGMRCIKMLVQQFLDKNNVKDEYQIFDVRVDHKLPELEDFDIFISSGGPDSPKPSGEKWEKKYFRFLDDLYDHNLLEERKKYLFLICHSFQLAIFHWKLAKVKRRKSTAFGIMPVHKTRKGKAEPFLEGLNNPFYAVDSRDYQVIKPKKKRLKSLGCSILCKEKKRPHVPLERAVMAIRFSDEIFGVQFHPEADSEGMLRYFKRADKKSHIIKHHGKKKYLDMIEHLDDDDKILKTNRTIIPRFLQQAADSLDRLKPISV